MLDVNWLGVEHLDVAMMDAEVELPSCLTLAGRLVVPAVDHRSDGERMHVSGHRDTGVSLISWACRSIPINCRPS